MSSSLDLSRAPLGQLAAARLVEAVAAGDDRLERHFLEVKSDLDLVKKNDVAKIAKYILGSANRLPEIAAAAFEGYGVMIIGVAPGDARGVPPIEILEISKIVSQYIGASGPQWDIVRVPVHGSINEVLVIVVDPPKKGQKPFSCRKEGDGLINGRIYIRADGETREAKADELDRLFERAAAQVTPDVSFEVTVIGDTFPLRIDEKSTIEAHIDRVRTQLLAALPAPQMKKSLDTRQISTTGLEATRLNIGAASMMRQFAKASSVAESILGSDPEERTEMQYRKSIEKWEQMFRAMWPDALDTLAGYAFNGVAIHVTNATKTFFHDVEVKIHLEGVVRGVDYHDGQNEIQKSDLNFPSPPRRWGPTLRRPFDPSLLRVQNYVPNIPSSYRSPLDWNNSGSVDLTLNVGELRPRQSYEFDNDELVLILPFTEQAEVHGTWEITARDHNDIFLGELFLKVGAPVDLTPMVRKLLELDLS